MIAKRASDVEGQTLLACLSRARYDALHATLRGAVIVVTASFSIPGLAAAQPALVVDNVTVIDGTRHIRGMASHCLPGQRGIR